jgi:hypothetical protein
MSTAFRDAHIHPFPHVWCNPVQSFGFRPARFLCHGNGLPDQELSVWQWRSGKCTPKLILASKWERDGRCVRKWPLLHLWRRRPWASTVWRQQKEWREQLITWRDLRELFYSHSDTVGFLIQSNCNELQPPINILIYNVWLRDHSVYPVTWWQPTLQTVEQHMTHRKEGSSRCLSEGGTPVAFRTHPTEISDKFHECQTTAFFTTQLIYTPMNNFWCL